MKANMLWNILDTGSVWLKEFACALDTLVPTVNWCPEIRNFGHWEKWVRTDVVADPPVQMIRFPLQRGYARFPIAQLFPFEKALAGLLQRSAAQPAPAALICTAPFFPGRGTVAGAGDLLPDRPDQEVRGDGRKTDRRAGPPDVPGRVRGLSNSSPHCGLSSARMPLAIRAR